MSFERVLGPASDAVDEGETIAQYRWRALERPRRPHRNAILGSISDENLSRFLPALEQATVPKHAVLFRSVTPTAYIYFPLSGVVALTNQLGGGEQAQMATVGREGLAGLHVFLETERASFDAVVQIAGSIWRVPVQPFHELVAASPMVRRLMLRYTEAFLTDASHSATCNALHRVSQRCARWLLAARDRVGNDRVGLSAQSLASTLGAHRDGVTVALRALQDEEIICGHRDYVDIIDLDALTRNSCSCYADTKARFALVSGASQ
jgi:CRP-like cAMP-binding protein